MKSDRTFTRGVIAVALLLVSYIGGFASAATSVSNLLLDSSVRSGRTAFDYTYRVVVSNGTPALAAASVSVTSTVATTVVLRGVASLGNLAANSTTTSADTITLRVDRTVPFDPTKLVWTFSGTAQATVPNIVGFTSAAAGTAIGLAGLVVGDVTAASSGTVATGNIISQAPSGGTTVNAGSSVSFVVSTGPAATTVPNIVGLTATDAGTAIGSAGLIVGNVTAAASPTVPVGKVISQNPASGTTVNVGSAVNFVVSTGPASVVVPNIVGLIPADAGTAIGAAGLVVGVVTSSPSSTVPAGRIISQNPADGASVSAGSAIDFVVSTGLPNVIVPNVVGLAQAAATSSIIAAGLAVGSLTAQSSDTVADGSVISESPAANTNVPLGTAIDIVVSTGPAQPGAPPGFLQGDRAAPAFGAVADLSDDPGPVLPRYQDLGNDTSVNLGALIVSFSPTATVANVNDVLTAIQGRITRSHPGSLLFYIRISPLASLDELNALIARLQTASGVADAFPSYRGGTTGTALPGNPPYQSPAPTSLQYLYPSLGAHFFGAWNAAGSPKVAQSPIVVVADFFGAGEPSDGYAFLATNLTGFQPFTPANPAAKTPNHGYWVLSALTASFGGGSGDVDLVTGAVPFAAHVTPVNIWGELLPRADFGVEKDFAAFVDDTMRAVAAATAGGKKAILNTSLCGGCVGGGYNAFNVAQAKLIVDAVRTRGLEGRFLHVLAAANTTNFTPAAPANAAWAQYNSWYMAYSSDPQVRALTGVAPLSSQNLLVVENAVLDGRRIRLGCLDPSSLRPGDVSADGSGLYALNGPVGGVSQVVGTSFAAPQVAGLAAYMWAFQPDMSPNTVRSKIIQTAQLVQETDSPQGCQPAQIPAPAIDAYLALASTDVGISAAGAPFRTAVFDVVDSNGSDPAPGGFSDGKFTEWDLARLVAELVQRNGALDFSRFDLNGDGYTGGVNGTAPFDLDGNGHLDSVKPTIAGVQVTYNETALTDAQVLCYYAYSDLFTRLNNAWDERPAILAPIADQCGLKLDHVELTYAGFPVGWQVSQGPTSLNSLSAVLNRQGTTTWSGSWSGDPQNTCGGEVGGFTSSVPRGAFFRAVGAVANPPYNPINYANRRPCSSFVAVNKRQLWISATSHNWTISGPNIREFESQSRLYSGDPARQFADGTIAYGDGSIGFGTFFSTATAPATPVLPTIKFVYVAQ